MGFDCRWRKQEGLKPVSRAQDETGAARSIEGWVVIVRSLDGPAR